ncbi:choice-of-anchor J domain-containing protein [Barnesiella viscericola]|uniref:choice-of-anchor J domain-containing protein n=2 Tax=Barnesiella viscericola TaxID=397865 RepID=UPI00255BCEF9|nr:choice-of-anchor J domain-containing protein [Barnesiella viscericola]
MKKNLLKGFLWSAALLLGSVNMAVAQEYNQRIAMEGVEMYGIVTFSAINQIDEMTPGMYKFGYDQQFKPDDNGVLFSRYIAGGGVYHEGKIYCNVYNDEANLSTQKPVWTILDAETYEVLYEKELPDNGVCTTKSLAYDITNDKIYGIVVDFTDSHLVEIDPATGDMTRVGDNFDRNLRFKTLVSTNNGMLYSIVIDSGVSSLYKIRKTDGLAVKVRDITAKNLLGPGDYLFNSGTEQAMFLNRSTGKAYWILESNSYTLDSEYSPIFEVNLTNAEATMVSYLSRCYQVSGAWFKEPNNGAPGIISDFEYVTPEEGSASGSIQFRLPENDYRGNPFTDSNLKIKVVEGDKVLVDATAQAGTLFKSEELALLNDNHTVSITLSNEKGSGPTIQRTFYAGYDLPAAPTNVKLSYEDLTTTLTWEAPTIGINGAPIDKENIYYKVIRLNGLPAAGGTQTVVAENLKECTFTETLPDDMCLYIYYIYSMYNGEEGGIAHSSDVVLGTPLNPPYGGMFTSLSDMFNYYTLIDANGDGYSWMYDGETRSAVYVYNQFLPADDWMISPPLNLKKDVDYTLSFKAYSSAIDYPESMEVTFGTGRTPEEQTKQLLDIPEVPSVGEDNPVTSYTLPVTVAEDGVYYYAFHVTSEKFREMLRVFDIRLDAPSGIETVKGEDSKLVITTGKNSVKVENPEGQTVTIYNSNGMLIDSFTDAAYERMLYPGIYIVKSNDSVQKIIVR